MRANILVLSLAMACIAGCGTWSGRYDGRAIDNGSSSGDDDSPQVPPMHWTDADGNTVNLYDYLDKKVVLFDVSAGWCVNCEHDAPSLEKDIWEPLEGSDFILIQLIVQDASFNPATPQVAAAWRDEFHLEFEVCADPNWSLKPYFLEDELPFLMLLDKKFHIQQKTHNYDAATMSALIKEFL